VLVLAAAAAAAAMEVVKQKGLHLLIPNPPLGRVVMMMAVTDWQDRPPHTQRTLCQLVQLQLQPRKGREVAGVAEEEVEVQEEVGEGLLRQSHQQPLLPSLQDQDLSQEQDQESLDKGVTIMEAVDCLER
jgi:hypothetical protein